MDEASDIVLGEAEQTSLKWAMGMPWFKRFADPASREAAFGDLCIRLEASGGDVEVDDLRERLQALRKYADQVEAERDRLRAVVDAHVAVQNEHESIGALIDAGDIDLLRDWGQRAQAAHVALVAALDVSADMGGDETMVTPEEMDNPDWYAYPEAGEDGSTRASGTCRWCNQPIALLPPEELPIVESAWAHVGPQPGTGRRNQVQCEPDMQSMKAEPTGNMGGSESWDTAAGEKP